MKKFELGQTVKVPEELIVIDFDITDENGKKSLEKNMEETYAELSKSGCGIHLYDKRCFGFMQN